MRLLHSVDYLARDQRDGSERHGVLVHRGFWLYLRRPLVTCAVLGHVPVIDGTGPLGRTAGYRWVCCDRCGERPEPQGSLDPALWDIGDTWPGPDTDMRGGVLAGPGSFARRHHGVLGGEVIVGRSHQAGISVKVGNAGSEHTLAGHVALGRAGTLYLHTERFGTWLQRRLNPRGYESMVTEVHVHNRRLWWQLWHPRDSWTKGTPRWRHGSAKLDPRDIVWGERRYSYEPHGEPVTREVRMAPDEAYQVTMQLQRVSYGRPGRRQVLTWSADCEHEPGIPTKPHGGEMTGWGVPVTSGGTAMWPIEAALASASKVAKLRARYGWPAPVMGDC